MRRKISLYIGDRLADLDDQSFILFNYTQEDLSNPTIVKNSFSQQITLKGTPANNAIFGDIYRNDRVTQYSGSNETGIYFDPNRKTTFTIYNELSEILEAGYLKLDRVTTRRNRVEYTCTLYGGLGSFLYGISYKSNGEKMSLADLTFPYSLGFTINRTTVKAAWDQLYNDPNGSNKWSIINFAPSYNGKPTKPFDTNKCVVHSDTYGLPIKDGEYTLFNEFSLVTLNDEVTEQETKDYRSYLQRPVLRLKAVINAICSSANNGGYTVNLDPEFFTDSNPYWNKTWISLPMLQDLNIDEASSSGTLNPSIGTISIPNGGSLNKLYNISLKISWSPIFVDVAQASRYWMHCEDDWAAGSQVNDNPGYYMNYLEVTVQCLDSSDNIIKEIVYRTSTRQSPEGEVQMDDVFDYITSGNECFKGNGIFYSYVNFQEYGISKIVVSKAVKSLSWGNLRASADPMLVYPENTYDYTLGESIYAYNFDLDNTSFSWEAKTSSTVRTGASISQASLLSGGGTPADYLLSFCKTFGLQLVWHKGEKVVDILLRKNFYNGSTIDLSDRIDRRSDIEKIPFAYDARWYGWQTPYQGDYAEYYADKYGLPYGKHRVNTGFDFNADDKNLTDGIVFNGVCDSLEVSKYFCDLEVNGLPVPSVFLAGGKYTLYKGGGEESKDYDLPFLGAATRKWINASYEMHDDWSKPQFHKADNAHMDIRDVLLFFVGVVYPYSDHCTLSDDTRIMLALNGNNPCWLPSYCDYDSSWQLARMPRFSRYLWNTTNVTKSLDYGTPKEVNVPGVSFNADSNIFDQYWANYITDRYDDDSAVVTAMVDLRGYQVNENLLRNFYFFDGAYWALNKIVNYSLTTWGLVQCEFVKVQSTTNYTTY